MMLDQFEGRTVYLSMSNGIEYTVRCVRVTHSYDGLGGWLHDESGAMYSFAQAVKVTTK